MSNDYFKEMMREIAKTHSKENSEKIKNLNKHLQYISECEQPTILEKENVGDLTIARRKDNPKYKESFEDWLNKQPHPFTEPEDEK
jgi:hypothetical protein